MSVAASMNMDVDKVALYLVLFSLVFIPFSPSLRNAYLLAIPLMLFGGQFSRNVQIARMHKMNYLALGLIVLLGVGMFYNPHSWQEARHFFLKYTHYLIIPLLFMPLFMVPKHRRLAINCFLGSAFVSALIFITWTSQLIHFSDLFHKPVNRFFPPISYSMYLAFAAYVFFNRCWDATNGQHRIWLGLAFLVVSYALFFQNIERTGMLIFLVLMVLFMGQRRGFKGVLMGVLGVGILFGLLYMSSNQVYSRVNSIAKDVTVYQQNKNTSIGLRLIGLKYGMANLMDKPWLGYGTGTYSAGDTGVPDKTMFNHTKTPENTYLHMALQIGLIGFGVFLAWMMLQYAESWGLPQEERFLAQGIVVSMAISNLTNPAFSTGLSALIYVMMLTILYPAKSN